MLQEKNQYRRPLLKGLEFLHFPCSINVKRVYVNKDMDKTSVQNHLPCFRVVVYSKPFAFALVCPSHATLIKRRAQLSLIIHDKYCYSARPL
jgi:hypothetical protein